MSTRTIRFNRIPGATLLAKAEIAVIGVGAIGRAIALQLASMGVKRLSLYDFDRVAEENLGTQGYSPEDLKCLKVSATRAECIRRNSSCEILDYDVHYPSKKKHSHPIMFLCVDTMLARNKIAEAPSGYTWLPSECLIDTRMGLFNGRIITDKPPYSHWKTTLFPDSEAAELPCGLQSTNYTSIVMAGWAIACMMRHLGHPNTIPCDLELNVLSNEIEELTIEALESYGSEYTATHPTPPTYPDGRTTADSDRATVRDIRPATHTPAGVPVQ